MVARGSHRAVPEALTQPDNKSTSIGLGASCPRVFYDPRALELRGLAGVLHARAAVVDDEAVFITSANLTEAALDRNIELGLIVRDRSLAFSVSTYLRTLVEKKLLLPLPGE